MGKITYNAYKTPSFDSIEQSTSKSQVYVPTYKKETQSSFTMPTKSATSNTKVDSKYGAWGPIFKNRENFNMVSYSCTQMGLPLPRQTSPSISTLSLTPGRCRDIDQDMHALRLSRQDNPFIQKVLASRESLYQDMEEMVSDDAILIQDFNSQVEPDPFQMPEVHEHMIRSPPPTSWPRNPNFSAFNFPQDNNNTITSQSSGDSTHSAIYFNMETEMKQTNRNGLTKNLSSSAIPRPQSSHQTESFKQAILTRPASQLEKFPSNYK